MYKKLDPPPGPALIPKHVKNLKFSTKPDVIDFKICYTINDVWSNSIGLKYIKFLLLVSGCNGIGRRKIGFVTNGQLFSNNTDKIVVLDTFSPSSQCSLLFPSSCSKPLPTCSFGSTFNHKNGKFREYSVKVCTQNSCCWIHFLNVNTCFIRYLCTEHCVDIQRPKL